MFFYVELPKSELDPNAVSQIRAVWQQNVIELLDAACTSWGHNAPYADSPWKTVARCKLCAAIYERLLLIFTEAEHYSYRAGVMDGRSHG